MRRGLRNKREAVSRLVEEREEASGVFSLSEHTARCGRFSGGRQRPVPVRAPKQNGLAAIRASRLTPEHAFVTADSFSSRALLLARRLDAAFPGKRCTAADYST